MVSRQREALKKKKWVIQKKCGSSRKKKSNWDRNKDELHNRLDTAKQRIEKLEDKLIKCPKVNAKKVEKNETEKPRTVGQLQKMCHDMGTLGRRENGEQKKC